MEVPRIPNHITRNLRDHAPVYGIGECSGRSSGDGESASGYKCVCIYVQNGLVEYADLFAEIARGVFEIQMRNGRRWALVVFGFGNSPDLQHEGKYFDLGYMGDSTNKGRVAGTMARISGSTPCSKAIIPGLYPKVGDQCLYSGKIWIDRNDLLVIVGRQDEVFLSEALRERVTDTLRKQVLMVQIGPESVSYTAREMAYEFK